jgi:hypothetical protein
VNNQHEEQLDFDLAPVTWAAMQVIDGSFVLTANEKRLLFKVYGFSRHDGCYASLETLADRLGLRPRTVEDTRTRLRKLGVLVVTRRRHQASIWRIMITRDSIPQDEKKIDADTFMRYRERVDNWLQFQDRRHLDRNVKPVRERVSNPLGSGSQTRQGTGLNVGEEGGGGLRTGTPYPPPPEDEDVKRVASDVDNYMQRHMQRRGYA